MRALRMRFPDIRVDESMRGLLYMEVGTFARYTQRHIDANDRDGVEQCFAFAREAWMGGDDEVQNALGVAYLEHLNFKDGKVARRWALDALPQPLREEYEALMS